MLPVISDFLFDDAAAVMKELFRKLRRVSERVFMRVVGLVARMILDPRGERKIQERLSRIFPTAKESRRQRAASVSLAS